MRINQCFLKDGDAPQPVQPAAPAAPAGHPTTIDLALAYASKGIPVFPANGQKRPLTSSSAANPARWGATTDPAIVRDYFSCYPNAMIGAAMGQDSQLIAVDCDVKNGIDGIAAYHAICAAAGHDPACTMSVTTPSGGRHYLYRYPTGWDVKNSASKIAPGIDIRGNGGYLVMAGSVNDKGKSYTLIHDADPAPCPDFLIDKINEIQAKTGGDNIMSTSISSTSTKESSEVKSDNDNNDIIRILETSISGNKSNKEGLEALRVGVARILAAK